MHLADAFIQSVFKVHSGYTYFCQYMCSLGIVCYCWIFFADGPQYPDLTLLTQNPTGPVVKLRPLNTSKQNTNYWNALLGGCSVHLINKLQMVQNTAARVLTRTRNYDYISPVVSTQDWLPNKHCVNFKILLITYKALNGLAPQFLSKFLLHYSPPRPLRSQNSGHLMIPRISKSTAGGRSFFYLAPKLWNNLPNTVWEADTLCQFKSRLKTHLLNLAYT